jgi:uncharacterized cupredoxin-like copper-binding protein
MSRLISVLLALPTAAVVAAGCGGGGSSSDTGTAASTTPTPAAPAQTQTSSSSASSSASSSSSSSGGGAAGAIAIAAQEKNGLSFSKKTLSAKAGKVTITMVNPSGNSLPHAIAVEGNGVDQNGQTVQPGGSASRVSLTLKPGKYTFFCPVDGHRAAGMEGTLTVS